MIITQSYTARSSVTLDQNALGLNLSTAQGRPPVHLHATVKDGLDYARLMGGLYALVTTNLLPPKRDRSAYFAWVHERYLEELAEQQARAAESLPGLFAARQAAQARLKEVHRHINDLRRLAEPAEYWAAVHRYYQWLYTYDRDAWMALDPVVSVHPDCVLFEAFSQDESSYGRVTVPMDRLDVSGPVAYGTTNIDFSPDLAREIGRIRSYRPTDLHVGPGEVALATTAGSAVEKKIDLPPTWVRGFLQVQSAAALPGVDIRLSAATLADVLSVIQQRREDRGPRSLRFMLTPGRRPRIVVEPWGTVIAEHTYSYDGRHDQEIRVWGRRRLLVLADLLPHADEVRVRLLGTGLPSYWSLPLGESRLDVGLSGWTQNDWARAAQFDLLASLGAPPAERLRRAAAVLEDRLVVTPEELAGLLNIDRPGATAALQSLCRDGRALYDYTRGTYRWRPLFPFEPEPAAVQEDSRLSGARRLLERRAVTWSAPPQQNAPSTLAQSGGAAAAGWRTFTYRDAKSDKFWNILLTGTSHVVHFGRTGTEGQRQLKEFATTAAAEASYNKLIKEKTGKGYQETTPPPAPAAGSTGEVAPSGERTRYTANVKGEHTIYRIVLDIDTDGRVVYAQCTCGTYRREKLRKGPCVHILATTVLAARQSEQTAAVAGA